VKVFYQKKGFVVFLLFSSLAFGLPKYPVEVKTLHEQNSYLHANRPLFWSLIPYYVHQEKGWSCSVASTVTSLNAMIALMKKPAPPSQEDALLTESFLVEKFSQTAWGRKTGISLSDLDAIIRKIFVTQSYPFEVEKIFADHLNKDSLQVLLEETEKAECILLINFLQSVFTQDAKIGHFSVIGAFNKEKAQVLILDPDRQYYEPYWVSQDLVLKAMQTEDDSVKHVRGLLKLSFKKEKK
jgi:hypothetical protein